MWTILCILLRDTKPQNARSALIRKGFQNEMTVDTVTASSGEPRKRVFAPLSAWLWVIQDIKSTICLEVSSVFTSGSFYYFGPGGHCVLKDCFDYSNIPVTCYSHLPICFWLLFIQHMFTAHWTTWIRFGGLWQKIKINKGLVRQSFILLSHIKEAWQWTPERL